MKIHSNTKSISFIHDKTHNKGIQEKKPTWNRRISKRIPLWSLHYHHYLIHLYQVKDGIARWGRKESRKWNQVDLDSRHHDTDARNEKSSKKSTYKKKCRRKVIPNREICIMRGKKWKHQVSQQSKMNYHIK